MHKIENKITIKINTGYHVKSLTSRTMKLLRSTKNKIIDKTNGQHIPHLEIIEATFVHCHIVNNNN